MVAGAQPADAWVIETVAGGIAPNGDGGAAVAAQLNIPYGLALDGAGNLYIADKSNHRIRKVVGAGPPAPVARPREPEPAVRARTLELAFVLRQDDAPAAQQVVLYAENGAVDFCAQPGQRWISVEPASGSLEEDEEAVLTVTVDPAGLRVGRREGRVYVRSGGRVTARVRIALTVQPPAGPAASQHGVVNAAVLSAFGERGLFGPRLLPLAPGSLVVVRGKNFTGGESFAAEGGSYPRRFLVGPHGPGIFTMSGGGGTGQAAAVLAGTTVLAVAPGFSRDIRLAQPAETVNIYTTSRPARAGDVLEIYATGLGPVSPPLADGENSCLLAGVCLADGSNVVLWHTAERPRVSIGGVAVAADGVLFSGLAPKRRSESSRRDRCRRVIAAGRGAAG